MSEVWDSIVVPTNDRQEVLRDILWRSVVRIDVDHHVEAPDIRTRMAMGQVGPVSLLGVESTGATIRRTANLVKDDAEPYVFVGLQLSGTSVVVQDGRQALLRPGEFAIYDTSVPYTLLYDHGIDQQYLRIPRSALALPTNTVRTSTAIAFGSDHPVANLASTYLRALVADERLRTGPMAETVAQPTIDLVRAVIALHAGADGAAGDSLRASLLTRIVDYMRAHLADDDLCAETIARAHSISVRHLYATLAASGISLGDWIRVRRLDECRKQLSRPESREDTIAAVAARWGFADAAHFSRAFSSAYGMTPREWRALRRA